VQFPPGRTVCARVILLTHLLSEPTERRYAPDEGGRRRLLGRYFKPTAS
jgi:hypothetical protein